MNLTTKLLLFLAIAIFNSSCMVSKKQYDTLKMELDAANNRIGTCDVELDNYRKQLAACNQETEKLKGDVRAAQSSLGLKDEQIQNLRDQISDTRTQRDKQVEQVGNLTVLSQSASDNIKETLSQLERKDKYINLIQAAKTKADSINLALAVNLKSVLKDGVTDEDVVVKVDKTVVFIDLSDKMLFNSGSANITDKAKGILGKIATIVQSRPEVEVMVEGHTDNVPIKNDCTADNWDLSAKRATAVVRILQRDYGIQPSRLIAAGRGEHVVLASNDSFEGRGRNRRTRIIILPKLDQFYDLLNPDKVPDSGK